MKKVAVTVAVLALGLAACQPRAEENAANATAVENAAEYDVNAASNDAAAMQNAAENALENAGNAVENAGNAVENLGDAAENAVSNAQ